MQTPFASIADRTAAIFGKNKFSELSSEQVQQVIGSSIRILVEAGMPINEAWDAVLGAGSYKKFVGDLYDALNQQAATTATKH